MPQTKTRVLIADDEAQYVRSLTYILQAKGYAVMAAADGQEAVESAEHLAPDVMMLDVRIPKVDGFETCRRIRAFSLAPIIMITALGHENDILVGLEAGADDYLIKPFDIEVLLARLEALSSWAAAGSEPGAPAAEFRLRDLRVDYAARQVWLAQQPVPLTAAEHRLLHELVMAAGRAVPQDVLQGSVWSPGRADVDQFVPIFIERLRKKIEADPDEPKYVLSHPGQCYSLGPARL